MPSKVRFRYELDENKDQALLGDYYNVLVTLETEEDITLTKLQLKIDGIESESTII